MAYSISGISSTTALDIQGMVTAMTSVYQKRLDKVYQNTQLQQFKQKSIQENADAIKAFRNTNFSVLSKDNLLSSSRWDTEENALAALEQFVNASNALTYPMLAKYTEYKSTTEASYKPLTEEEQLAMTESEIEKWNSIAAKGVLHGDQTTYQAATAIRQTISNSELRKYIDIARDGTLSVNTKKVSELYQSGGNLEQTFLSASTTFLSKLDNSYSKMTGQIGVIDGRIENLALEYADKQAKLTAAEDKYYAQFTKLQTLIDSMESQTSMFTSLFSTK